VILFNIRSRPFCPAAVCRYLTPAGKAGCTFLPLHERLEELRLIIEGLKVTSRVCFDHGMNSWTNNHGGLLFFQDGEVCKFREEKQIVSDLIREGLRVAQSRHVDIQKRIAMGSL